MRKRAGALIINNGKLLLISEANQGFYWSPGGGLEAGEDFMDALARELKEELGTELQTAEHFLTYMDDSADEEVRYFLVTLASSPQPADSRTLLLHYSRNDFNQNTVPISKRIYGLVYPRLIEAELV